LLVLGAFLRGVFCAVGQSPVVLSPAMARLRLVALAALACVASGLTGLSQALRAGARDAPASKSSSSSCIKESNRRHVLLAGAAALPVLGSPFSAVASGGATAGKTTSIPRAKLRYYDRISAAVGQFTALGGALGESGTLKQAYGAFFSEADYSPYQELKGAGFLLAVAFKLDSKIPPDRLQTVKDYKVLMKDLDALKAARKPDAALAAYAKAKASMDVYLDGVQLPPLGDQRYAAA